MLGIHMLCLCLCVDSEVCMQSYNQPFCSLGKEQVELITFSLWILY